MKFVFLSVLSAIALNTLSFAPAIKKTADNDNLKFSNVVGANNDLTAPALNANNSGDYIECTGEVSYWVSSDKVEYFNGHGQCWYQLYVDVPIKDVDSSEWNTVCYTGFENNCWCDFFSEDITFDKQNGCFVVNLYSRDNIQGSITIFYSYMHDYKLETWPDPVDNNGLVNPPETKYTPKKTIYKGRGKEDDTVEEAHKVPDCFRAEGYLKPNNNKADQDWYKIQIYERVKYTINFRSPNSDYKLTIFKSRRQNQNNYDVVQRFKWSQKVVNKNVYLTAGTYYIRVSLENVDSWVNSKYSLVFSYSQTNRQFPIYYNNLKNFKAVVWENDYLPDNVPNRWEKTRFELHTLTTNTNMPQQNGYVDDIFYNSGLETNKLILDSVIYVWGHDELVLLKKTLETLQKVLRQQELQIRRHKEIVADISSLIGGTLQLALSGVSIYNGAGRETIITTNIDDSSTIGGVGDNTKSIVEAICDIILGTVETEIDYFTTKDSALSLLIGCCDGLTDNPKGVICIPVYAQIKRESYADRGLIIYEYQRSFVPYQRLYKSRPDESSKPTNVFRYDTISEHQYIYKLENEEVVETRYYHGKLTTFTSVDELRDYVNYDYIAEGNV